MTVATPRQRAAMAVYYQKHKANILAKQAADRLANPEKFKVRKENYYANNPEKVKAQASGWAKKNPEKKKSNDARWRIENAERVKANNISWRKSHPEKVRELRSTWAAANREKVRASVSKWNKANPESRRAHKAIRRARNASSVGRYSSDDVKALVVSQRGKCVVCRCDLGNGYHVDHIEPLVRGGRNDRFNIQLLCPSCNCQKNAKNPISFMQSKGYLL